MANATASSAITAKQIIKELDQSLKEFGEYNYYDKGVSDVVDVDSMTKRLKELEPPTIMNILKEVAAHKHGPLLVSGLIGSFDDDDDLWNALEAIDADFIGEHY